MQTALAEKRFRTGEEPGNGRTAPQQLSCITQTIHLNSSLPQIHHLSVIEDKGKNMAQDRYNENLPVR